MSAENEKAVRKLYELAEQKDIAGFVAAFTEDGTFTDKSINVTYRGTDIGDTVVNYGTAFPDMHRELYQFYSTGNIVVVQLASAGHPPRPAQDARRDDRPNRQADGCSVL